MRSIFQYLTGVICLIAFLSKVDAKPPDSPRLKFNFNSSWKVFVGDAKEAEQANFNDSSWKMVTLPYAWNEEEAFKRDIRDLSTGIAWYRKHFKLPLNKRGSKVFLEFEGIRQAGEFYINGKYIGLHENGVMAFGLDITDYVKYGDEENVLAVRTNNDWEYKEKSSDTKYQWSDKNFNANYGGIPKNVFLHIADRLYQTLPLFSFLKTTGSYIYAREFNIADRSATIVIESEIRNEYPSSQVFKFEATIQDKDGRTVKIIDGGEHTIQPGEMKTIKTNSRVSGLNFWSWGYGYLYTVATTIKVGNNAVDVVKTKTGFRKTEFSEGMVRLNDRVIMMKGYAQRTSNEWPAVGISIPPWLSDYSNNLMVESNANLVRWMHITPRKQDIESCDRVGLIQAMPAGDSERDPDGRRWGQRLELMRDAMIYNRNNPSILFYESGNKGVSEEHMAEMIAIRDKYDPFGGRASGSREMLKSTLAEYGGEMLYINKSARKPLWAMEYSRDEALRKYWDNYSPPYHKDGDGPLYNKTDASIYNRNQDSQAIENIKRWFDYWKERPGTGDRVSSGGVNIIFSDTNTHHRGEENYRRSGEVDAVRIPKDGFFAHQVMWDGWVDADVPRIHIIGHWTYKEGVEKDLFIVSSADSVELFTNGRSAGKGKQQYRFLFTFDKVKWTPGLISAVGYRNGKQVCKAEKKTTGVPHRIQLRSFISSAGLHADGADLALIEVEVVDEEGNRCPTALNTINFSLKGPAQWKGGMAQGPDNYILSKALPVECGVNRVLIRTTTESGKIEIDAVSEGLSPAHLEVRSLSIKVKDGLSLNMTDEGLLSPLKRGATPATPSFMPVRKSLKVVHARCGANDQENRNSYDDDETTSWNNKGDLSTAWIEFELDRISAVSEVTMKLAGLRARTYPVRILVDGAEAFSGIVDRSLGYSTVSFKAVRGKLIKLELVGRSVNRDAFSNIIELAGNKPEPGSENSDTNLDVIEIEFYEVLK